MPFVRRRPYRQAAERAAPESGRPRARRSCGGTVRHNFFFACCFQRAGQASTLPPALQAAWLELARKVVANTEDVGSRFADEARRMHHGEVQDRAIRGQATAQEALQLLDEGIAVMPLPAAVKETLQ